MLTHGSTESHSITVDKYLQSVYVIPYYYKGKFMLNLLFISDSPKAEYVKGVLQPLLKVIIDVVTDFDHGLKDVFEKRPATVCIQDQIGGVTGESVARHIQMLLGSSAPTFILLHSGKDKARAVKGLYEHIVDLSQPDETVAENVINILKVLLGDQWGKIFIQPKLSPASVRQSVAVPEESREDADRLVDDFLTDLKMSAFPVMEDQVSVTDTVTKKSPGVAPSVIPHVSGTVDSDRAGSISDDLAEVEKEGQDKSAAKVSSTVGADQIADLLESPESATGTLKQMHISVPVPPELSRTSPAGTQSAKTALSDSEKKDVKASSVAVAAPPSPAAEFRVNQNQLTSEDDFSEDIFQAFEKNYRSEPKSPRLVAATVVLASVVCMAAGWYLVMQKPQLIGSLKQRYFTPSVATQSPVAQPVAAPAQIPAAAPHPVVTPPLPAFLPVGGHDSSYSIKNPGWERYVGKVNEFRIFRVSGRIQAVQVLGVKGAPVSEQLIKSVLQELAGSSQYQITSRKIKAGVNIENGTIKNKGEIVLYKKSGTIQAFVVSVNQ